MVQTVNANLDSCALTPACDTDADEISELYLASRADALPFLRRVHTDNEVRDWIRNVALKRGETWIARRGAVIVGFLRLVGDEIDQLYVRPGHYRTGVGKQLLELAKEQRPRRLFLYTFMRNTSARTFYEAQGFRLVDSNAGDRNEENEPDSCYEWTPSKVPGPAR